MLPSGKISTFRHNPCGASGLRLLGIVEHILGELVALQLFVAGSAVPRVRAALAADAVFFLSLEAS